MHTRLSWKIMMVAEGESLVASLLTIYLVTTRYHNTKKVAISSFYTILATTNKILTPIGRGTLKKLY